MSSLCVLLERFEQIEWDGDLKWTSSSCSYNSWSVWKSADCCRSRETSVSLWGYSRQNDTGNTIAYWLEYAWPAASLLWHCFVATSLLLLLLLHLLLLLFYGSEVTKTGAGRHSLDPATLISNSLCSSLDLFVYLSWLLVTLQLYLPVFVVFPSLCSLSCLSSTFAILDWKSLRGDPTLPCPHHRPSRHRTTIVRPLLCFTMRKRCERSLNICLGEMSYWHN